ncbi:MAG: hypothetical protein WCD35_06180 [Mycobacteriales bacterium]
MLTAPVRPTPWELHTPGLRVRQARAEDLADLAALKRRVERLCYAHLGSAEALAVRLHRRCTAWYLLTCLGAGDLLLVAELEGVPIGLGAARVTGDAGQASLHLHSTYVERPGVGAGRALTVARLEAANRLGLRTVTADCLLGAARAAHRLAALGLEDTGRRSASPTFPGVALSHWAGSLHTALDRART